MGNELASTPVSKPGYFIRRPEQGRPITSAAEAELMKHSTADPATKEAYLKLLSNPTVHAVHVAMAAETGGFHCAHVSVAAGADFPRHYHRDRIALIYIIKGGGKVILDGTTYPLKQGDVVFIARNTEHEIIAEEPIEYLAVVNPSFENSQGTIDFVFT